MKAIVDTGVCAGHAQCVETCPEVFEMNDGVARVKVDTVPPAKEQSCRDAADGCPMSAITIEK